MHHCTATSRSRQRAYQIDHRGGCVHERSQIGLVCGQIKLLCPDHLLLVNVIGLNQPLSKGSAECQRHEGANSNAYHHTTRNIFFDVDIGV